MKVQTAFSTCRQKFVAFDFDHWTKTGELVEVSGEYPCCGYIQDGETAKPGYPREQEFRIHLQNAGFVVPGFPID